MADSVVLPWPNRPPPTITEKEHRKKNTERKTVSRAHARDVVWDHFANRYQTEYGETPTHKEADFVGLARLRRQGKTDAEMTEHVDWMFLWNLYGHTGRWTMDDFISRYNKIPKPGENHNGHRDESATERILRQSREAKLADKQRAPAAGG
jgi:hypothetical protein